MIKKQLNIWKKDFLKYYNKTSLMTRIIIGALISFIIAYFSINKIVKPQNAELKKLNEKIQSLDVVDNLDVTLVDLKNKQRKANMILKSVNKINDKLAVHCGSLTKQNTAANIIEIRTLIDKYNLKIISEALINKKQKKTIRRSVRNKKIDTRIKISFPKGLTSDGYKFQVLGRFEDIRKFLISAFMSKSLYFINNIQLDNSKELISDRNFRQFKALNCTFEVHIPYKGDAK